jgi:hypothetical protein
VDEGNTRIATTTFKDRERGRERLALHGAKHIRGPGHPRSLALALEGRWRRPVASLLGISAFKLDLVACRNPFSIFLVITYNFVRCWEYFARVSRLLSRKDPFDEQS